MYGSAFILHIYALVKTTFASQLIKPDCVEKKKMCYPKLGKTWLYFEIPYFKEIGSVNRLKHGVLDSDQLSLEV